MKISIITQYYPPERINRTSELALGLKDLGHDVNVVTAFPNYPDGKLFDGYKQKFGHAEDISGIPVRRVPVFISHSQNAVGRILNYLSFGFNSLSSSSFTKSSDVVYVYATQITAAIGPYWWKKFRGQPYVLHIQDLWPESVTGSGMLPKWLSQVAKALMTPLINSAYRNAAAVIGISPTMTQTLTQRGATPQTSSTLFNWSENEPTLVTDTDQEELPLSNPNDDSLRVIYAGNIGPMQDWGTVLDALSLLEDDNDRLILDAFGTGTSFDEISARADRLKLYNTKFHGWIQPESLEQYYRQADFVLVTLKDLEVFEMTIPSKFQSAIANGIPVITNVPGDLARIVKVENLGFVASPGSPSSLAQAFSAALSSSTSDRASMSANAKALYHTQMSVQSGVRTVAKILEDTQVPKTI